MRPAKQVEERAARLRLALTPGLSGGAARALLREYGLPTALFEPALAPARLAPYCGFEAACRLRAAPEGTTAEALARSQDWLDAAPRRFLLSLADADFPKPLLDLADPPVVLFAEGRRELLGEPALAIVGSRSATRQGTANAAAFAEHLCRAGLCIVSGMAEGIDAAAHRGALSAGGQTIAVLGTGIDIVYPAGNRALAGELAREGLMLSEYPAGTPPRGRHFPRRNRLIAALSRGVLVVEAAVHSGSLITARIAAELGREVFAIPGSIHSPLARGCHRLIRDGAKLVESAQDVAEELRLVPPGARPPMRAAASPPAAAAQEGTQCGDADAVLAALGHDPIDMDALVQRTGTDAGRMAARLLQLELDGAIERLPGNRFQRLR